MTDQVADAYGRLVTVPIADPGLAVVRHVTVPFTFADKARLVNGIQFADSIGPYVSAIGDTLLNAWVATEIAFNGTTPKADLGTFAGGVTVGLFAEIGPVDLTAADTLNYGGDGLSTNFTVPSLVALGGGSYRSAPTVFTAVHPLLAVASQGGDFGGTVLDSTAGSAIFHAVILTTGH
jgi:hypothetical protein